MLIYTKYVVASISEKVYMVSPVKRIADDICALRLLYKIMFFCGSNEREEIFLDIEHGDFVMGTINVIILNPVVKYIYYMVSKYKFTL